LRGGVGLYTEDAHVHFRQPTVKHTPSETKPLVRVKRR
jgi:hypothetical protein